LAHVYMKTVLTRRQKLWDCEIRHLDCRIRNRDKGHPPAARTSCTNQRTVGPNFGSYSDWVGRGASRASREREGGRFIYNRDCTPPPHGLDEATPTRCSWTTSTMARLCGVYSVIGETVRPLDQGRFARERRGRSSSATASWVRLLRSSIKLLSSLLLVSRL